MCAYSALCCFHSRPPIYFAQNLSNRVAFWKARIKRFFIINLEKCMESAAEIGFVDIVTRNNLIFNKDNNHFYNEVFLLASKSSLSLRSRSCFEHWILCFTSRKRLSWQKYDKTCECLRLCSKSTPCDGIHGVAGPKRSLWCCVPPAPASPWPAWTRRPGGNFVEIVCSVFLCEYQQVELSKQVLPSFTRDFDSQLTQMQYTGVGTFCSVSDVFFRLEKQSWSPWSPLTSGSALSESCRAVRQHWSATAKTKHLQAQFSWQETDFRHVTMFLINLNGSSATYTSS